MKKRQRNEFLMQGNEAVVEGALAAGCRFFAGYPITPATEISEVMAVKLPQVDGTFIQMEDEIA
ncbi:MAG: 2-oxoacid:acceptor oxidoreductase subunit alpha, partial [Deltaproteobacteria bacterium]|nr:2-oxoacid:acceptor oxidoreductase subunit alpha [Deltaproteobacteria bacterium]